MDASSGIGCGVTAIGRRRRLRRIKNAVMISTRTKPPTVPPAIAPTDSSLSEGSLSGNVVAGVVVAVVADVTVEVTRWAKIWASFGLSNPWIGLVVVACPVSLH